MSTASLVVDLKAAGEDFEWYPTTKAMLSVIAQDAKRKSRSVASILDIGAGDGSSLAYLSEACGAKDLYAIEKSVILTRAMPKNIFIIGTDFHEQTLIDKQMDVVFCNPPYREYAEWMVRIIKEAPANTLYFVVPERWRDNEDVRGAIKARYADAENPYEILDSFCFNNSEYRASRAQVDIVRFDLDNYRRSAGDPFTLWFNETFVLDAERVKEYSDSTRAEDLHEMVKGYNLIERLEDLYKSELAELLSTYRTIEKLDPRLFRELGVSIDQIRGGLKQKISGLKRLYWKELFDNLDTLTSRLTSKSRKALYDTLTSHTDIDFTANNAYAVIMWAVKNANHYFDKQLCDVYLDLTEQENIINYKSNKVILNDKWRYAWRSEVSHYTLDYRLVLNRHSCFDSTSYRSYDYPNGLSRDVHAFLNDICTVAGNLGFLVSTNSYNLYWTPGQKNDFYMADGALFMDVRAFKKGTIHIRLDQNFMRKFNVEAGRLNGWIKDEHEAANETGIEEAAFLFGSNYQLSNMKLLPVA